MESFIIHPQYDAQLIENDYAIIKLKQNITFSSEINAACLPSYTDLTKTDGEIMTVSGWGNTYNVDPESCANGLWINDGYCDDETNNADCNFDGGDCCGDSVNTQYCTECQCLGQAIETDADRLYEATAIGISREQCCMDFWGQTSCSVDFIDILMPEVSVSYDFQ